MQKKTKAIYTVTSTYDIQRNMIFTLSEGAGRKFFLPILHPLSVVGSAILRLSGDGVKATPGATLCVIVLFLFLFGQFFIGNKFFHI